MRIQGRPWGMAQAPWRLYDVASAAASGDPNSILASAPTSFSSVSLSSGGAYTALEDSAWWTWPAYDRRGVRYTEPGLYWPWLLLSEVLPDLSSGAVIHLGVINESDPTSGTCDGCGIALQWTGGTNRNVAAWRHVNGTQTMGSWGASTTAVRALGHVQRIESTVRRIQEQHVGGEDALGALAGNSGSNTVGSSVTIAGTMHVVVGIGMPSGTATIGVAPRFYLDSGPLLGVAP